MAKLISHIFSVMRGKVAGIVYLTTPSGAIIGRQLVQPVQPTTNPRTTIRNALVTAVSNWDNLTSEKRQQWEDWAAAHPGKTGREWMIGGETLLLYAANLPYPTAPIIDSFHEKPEFTDVPSLTVSVQEPFTAGTGIGLKITNEGSMAVYVSIESSTPLPQTRNYWRGPWVPSLSDGAAIAAGATANVDIFNGAVGDKIFARVRAATNDTASAKKGHIVSAASIVSGIAATTV